MQTLSFN